VVLELLMVAGVLVVAVPALLRGVAGLRRRSGHYSSDVTADRISLVLPIAVLVVLTSGRRDPRRVHRRATPAAR
jgi:hypothetical protein